MPRWVDAGLAVLGLIVCAPLLAAVALVVKVSSPGPVLFLQERIGHHGKPFVIVKFRTMVQDAELVGGRLTVGDRDPRVTRIGWLLRKCKLDELPQLWNVLVGDMKFVGPRPEVPEFVRLYNEVQRAVLLVPPGITDPASIAFRDESELLALAEDPEGVYLRDILPRKLELNQEYQRDRTGWSDARVMVQTVRKAVLRV